MKREATLAANDGVAGDRFGWSAGMYGGTAIGGSPGDGDARGAAYVFRVKRGMWVTTTSL